MILLTDYIRIARKVPSEGRFRVILRLQTANGFFIAEENICYYKQTN